MPDTMTPEQRHRCMAAIKGKDTKPEMLVRRYLHARGFRYGLHNRRLPGSPDIVLRSLRTVIFVHGCFWHGHKNCGCYRLPKSNVEFWQKKIDRNRKRDVRVTGELQSKGWNVMIVWECELKNKQDCENTLARIARELTLLRNPAYATPSSHIPEAAEPEVPYFTKS